MKKNIVLFGLPGFGVQAFLLSLCVFTSVSYADIVVDNTGDTHDATGSSGVTFAQVFTMGTAGNISSLTLSLSGSASSEVYVYSATSGSSPSSAYNGLGNALYDLGNVSASSPTITGLNDSLSAGGTYAIVLALSGSQWNLTTSSSIVTDNGSSIGGLYYDNAGTWSGLGGDFAQMNLAAVPEVPMTGAVMGFGVLAIAVGATLRRKLRPAVSSIA
ncbi:MAG TPA: hypothetical protein VIK53_07125 [Verrucomicrobiae bacterium]